MTSIEISHLHCARGMGDEFGERLEAMMKIMLDDEDCHEIVLYRGVKPTGDVPTPKVQFNPVVTEDPDEFCLIVTWTSVDAHNVWTTTAAQPRVAELIKDMLDGPPRYGNYSFVSRRTGA